MPSVDVSVILPCYNVESFLDQALSSAEQNDRINLEIIAVNDGSKDNTLDIMRAHAAADPRVHVIDKPNGGYGAGMNRGISEAHGTYIAILEPDDWIEPHMYDDMFEYAMTFADKGLPDIVKTPYTRVVLPQTPDEYTLRCSYYGRVDPGFQPFTLADAPHLIQHHPSIWSAIYRKDFLEENGIRFKEAPGAGWVDNPFLIETLCQAKSIVYLEKAYYNYREDLPGSSSVLRSAKLSFDRWNDMADIIDRLGVIDDGILKAFYVIGFRYAGGAFAQFGDDNEEVIEWVTQIFRRMDPARVVRIKNLSGNFKKRYFALTGYEPIRFSDLPYIGALFDEFIYSTKTNGVGYSFGRIRWYARQKLTEMGIIKQKIALEDEES